MIKRQEEAAKYGGTYEAPAFSAPTRQAGPEAPKRQPTNAEIKKMFADARGSKAGSVDAEGKPIRKYLTEPPAAYREPDPTSTVPVDEEPEKKKKKFSLKNLWPF
jgi:hypothetical protein